MAVTAMYVRAVKSLGLVPDMLKVEHVNEARVMVVAHCAQRQNPDADRYGTSVANQRNFRHAFTSWLVNFFQRNGSGSAISTWKPLSYAMSLVF